VAAVQAVNFVAIASACTLTIAAYVVAARGGSRSRPWPRERTLAFAAGVIVLGAGIAPLWGDGFTGHVVAHLLLGMIAPLLLVLGDPLGLGLVRCDPSLRRRTLRVLGHPIVRAVSKPAAAWALAVLTPWVLWLSPLYDLTERNAPLHGLVHLHFVVAGVLFTSVVLGMGPLGRRVPPAAGLLLLALTLPIHALLGLVVLSMEDPLLGVGADASAALADQRRGAVVMWLAGDLIATVMIAAAFPRWLREERRRARREDARVAAAWNAAQQ
jgi:putative membrane protein